LAQLLPRQSLNESVLQSCQSCDECLAVEPRLVHHFATSLRRAQFGLSWIYLDALDECGHAHGGNSPAYPALVAKVDGWVGTVLEALRSAGIADSTLILIMSDHGRDAATGRSHGGFTTSELRVQWLLAGPGIKASHELTWPVSIMDGAPTLLHALGIRPPVEFYGRVVREAFHGDEATRLVLAGRGWHAPNASADALGLRTTAQRASSLMHGWVDGWVDGWHRPSLLVGGLLGAVGAVCLVVAVTVTAAWMRARHSLGSVPARPHPFFLSGPHPAADRLRAAAGEPDHEMQGLLR